jgi:hypothetical protein
MRQTLFVIILLFATSSNAALLNYGVYTKDTSSGLDWLDLSQTDGMTISGALATNSGWRYATFSEIDALYATAFPTAPDDVPFDDFGVYGTTDPVIRSNVETYMNLFGITQVQSSTSRSSGIYFDDNGQVLGMSIQTSGDNVYRLYKHVIDYITIGFDNNPEYSDSRWASHLVRTSTIPIPASVWLLGSALASLGWTRRKKTAQQTENEITYEPGQYLRGI